MSQGPDISFCTETDPCKVKGEIVALSVSGRGPNSGGIVITVRPTGESGNINLLCAIIDDNKGERGKLDGVFASFATMAALAFQHRIDVEMSYIAYVFVVGDVKSTENHVHGITFPPRPSTA